MLLGSIPIKTAVLDSNVVVSENTEAHRKVSKHIEKRIRFWLYPNVFMI